MNKRAVGQLLAGLAVGVEMVELTDNKWDVPSGITHESLVSAIPNATPRPAC